MSNRLSLVPVHIIDTATEARAERNGFHIEQQVFRRHDINAQTSWRLVKRGNLPNLHGSRAECHNWIATLQKRHASSGYNAEFGYWWGHDMPEGGTVPDVVYRWVLV